LILAVVVLGIDGAAFADVAVPPELRGWEEWALQGHETHRCPWLAPGSPADGTRICAWPSVLDLQADERGGRFSQRWQAAAETWLPLPGSTENWPEDVTLDGAPAAVVAHDGAPALRVGSGVHTLAGVFRWTRRPELLALPSDVALVSLSINGGHVLNPQRIEPVRSDGVLTWFIDQAAEQFPTPSVLSISLWWYKIAILAWALWLSFALTRWT
jgi:hypothetical protein